MSSNTKIPTEPFNKIGLSLSGGGYRAAAFHLGTMSYLNRIKYFDKPLLEHVEMISTVSGGTITGVFYAFKKSEGSDFNSFYCDLMKILESIDLVKEALKMLHVNSEWNYTKKKNLINAFSILYDKHFTHGKTIKEINNHSHLKHVVFNSTEFKNGINFRFRNINSYQFGNYYHKISKDKAEEVKLSDIIAASSCFPGGFEPINWPNDFIYDGAENLIAYAKKNLQTGLMDGGIYDNQGIDSLLMRSSKLKNGKYPYFDLIIVSDVASPYIQEFKFTENGSFNWSIKKFNIAVNLSLIFLSIVFALFPFIWDYKQSMLTIFFSGLSFSLVILFAIYNGGKFYVKNKVDSFFSTNADYQFFKERFIQLEFNKISLSLLKTYLSDRFHSVNSLVHDVFMKVIRGLQFKKLYHDVNCP